MEDLRSHNDKYTDMKQEIHRQCFCLEEKGDNTPNNEVFCYLGFDGEIAKVIA